MSNEGRNQDTLPSSTTQTGVLESACEESREVLDHQLSVQDDIDEKAIWSVRTSVLVLGLLLSAGSLGNLSKFLTLPWYVHGLTGSGVSLLLLSVFFGIGTYTMTETYPGLDHHRRTKAHREDYGYEEWQWRLLFDYQRWIRGQETWNEYNGLYLFITHVCLLVGTTATVIAGIVSLFLSYDSWSRIALVGGMALPAVAVMVLLLWARKVYAR